jgi:hypothetical protein
MMHNAKAIPTVGIVKDPTTKEKASLEVNSHTR